MTHWAGVLMPRLRRLWVTTLTSPTGLDSFPIRGHVHADHVLLRRHVGNASTFGQMPMLFEPRQAGGVIGFTAAIAAYGPSCSACCLPPPSARLQIRHAGVLRPGRLVRLRQRRAELVDVCRRGAFANPC